MAETVATPIEQEVNGVERMLYMSSRCTNDGQMYLDVTFEVGTNLDMAQVLVQNRVSVAEAKLPEEVRRRRDHEEEIASDPAVRQRDLARRELRPALPEQLRADEREGRPGPPQGGRRRRLPRPARLQHAGLAGPEQAGVSRHDGRRGDPGDSRTERPGRGGRIGQPPVPEARLPFQLTINTQGRIESAEDFDKVIVKTGQRGQNVYLKDVARETKFAPDGRELEKGVELGAKNYNVNSYLDGKPAVTLAVFQLPGSNALKTADAVKAKMRELKDKFPRRGHYAIYYDTTSSSTNRFTRSTRRCSRLSSWCSSWS